jgi:tRNA threonylcarbamoyladenosine biosynthesis protein TsaE
LNPKASCPYSRDGAQNSPPPHVAGGQNVSFTTDSYEETFVLGLSLGKTLKKGGVVALEGPLGAGKTCLCSGICYALGVDEPVTSPTYTIIHEYEGRFPVYHIDAYRLSGPEDFEGAGGVEALYGGGVCLVEWAERVSASLPPSAVHVKIAISDAGKREIHISGSTGLRTEN